VLRDLLGPADLGDGDVEHLVELASAIDGPGRRELAGQLVVLYLSAPAPEAERTFTAAAARLDARLVLGPEEYQGSHGATAPDVARTASLFGALLVVCTGDHDVDLLAEASRIPVLDGPTALDHLCPTLAALLARRTPGPDPDHESLVRCAAALLLALRRRELADARQPAAGER
jgi:ornithine carbamoyltransferase